MSCPLGVLCLAPGVDFVLPLTFMDKDDPKEDPLPPVTFACTKHAPKQLLYNRF